MKSISLYVDKKTFLTALHPFTKLIFVAAAIFAPLIAGDLWCFLIMIGISVILLISGGLLRKALPLLVFSFTILITIFLIQGLFYKDNETPSFYLGKLIFYREGLLYASRIGLNILNMLLSFTLFVLSTDPFLLVEELERAGMSQKAGYIIISVFQIIPQMTAAKNTIMDAQRSRGLETEGRLLTRARAFLPLLSPVVTSALINTRERAASLVIRGFETKVRRTFLAERRFTGSDRIWIALMVLCLTAAVLWRIFP